QHVEARVALAKLVCKLPDGVLGGEVDDQHIEGMAPSRLRDRAPSLLPLAPISGDHHDRRLPAGEFLGDDPAHPAGRAGDHDHFPAHHCLAPVLLAATMIGAARTYALSTISRSRKSARSAREMREVRPTRRSVPVRYDPVRGPLVSAGGRTVVQSTSLAR